VSKPLLVFDMDGVLVDVSESYRETIARTVEHFTGVKPTREQIQDYKNEGGHNDDWQLSHYAIAQAGVDVPFGEVKDYFQSIFLGANGDGLIQREEWIARTGVLEKLAESYRFAIFTGRPRGEAELTLRRFAPEIAFETLIAMEDVKEHKPAPEGLLAMKDAAFYIGDTVDDARCARAAKVPFIGIAGPSNPRYIDLVFLFQGEGSYAIIDDINYLEEVFAS
jgi:HAD superfamily hydrolase (TIGR01548 family)